MVVYCGDIGAVVQLPSFAALIDRFLSRKWSSFRSHARSRRLAVDETLDSDRGVFGQIICMECYYCGLRVAGGIDRVDSRRGYLMENIVASCTPCNMLKGTLALGHFFAVVSALHHFRHNGVRSTGAATFPRSRPLTFGKWRGNLRTPALRRGVELTPPQFQALLDGACAYCGLLGAKGIDRVEPQGNYTLENCVSCCCVCNYVKGSRSVADFEALVDAVFVHIPTPLPPFNGLTVVLGHTWSLSDGRAPCLHRTTTTTTG